MGNDFFSTYLERLETLARDFSEAIQDLSPEALDWVPGAEMNSIAVLLAHTTGSLRFWVGDVGLGDPSQRNREREFQTRGLTAADLLARLDAVIDYTRGALPRLRLEDLDQICRPEVAKRDVTCGWALLHGLEHGALHLGHVQLTAQLWKEKSAAARLQ